MIVALDRTLDCRKLDTAYQALRCGARSFATNTNGTCPLPDGVIPDASILAALRAAAVAPLLGDLLSAQPALVSEADLPKLLKALDELGYTAKVDWVSPRR